MPSSVRIVSWYLLWSNLRTLRGREEGGKDGGGWDGRRREGGSNSYRSSHITDTVDASPSQAMSYASLAMSYAELFYAIIPACFLTFCCSAIPTSPYIFLLFFTLVVIIYTVTTYYSVGPRVHSNKSVQLPYGIHCHHLGSMSRSIGGEVVAAACS